MTDCAEHGERGEIVWNYCYTCVRNWLIRSVAFGCMSDCVDVEHIDIKVCLGKQEVTADCAEHGGREETIWNYF